MRWASMMAGALALLLVMPAAGRGAGTAEKPARDAAVAMTNAGEVSGHVYDATTGLPLPGTQVAVQQDGAFAEKGTSTAVTDELGLYRCRAPIGRTSTSYSVAGILFGPLAGPASTRTQRIDVTQLTVRVTKAGYLPFEGVVRCRTTDADRYAVRLEPILLLPQGAGEVSTAADGWGALQLLDLTVEPRLLHPGEKAKLTVRVRAPAAAAAKKGSFWSSLFGGKKAPLRLAMVSSLSDRRRGLDIVSSEGGEVIFAGEFEAPRKVSSPSVTLLVFVEETPIEILAGTSSKRALVQVLPPGAAEEGARLRLEAAARLEAGDTAQAQAKVRELCARPEASLDDARWLVRLSELVHDSATQVSASQQALALLPKERKSVLLDGQEVKLEAARWMLMADYARALVANGQAADLLSQVKPEVDKVKEKDRPRSIPGPVMIALGRAYLDRGNVTEAVALRDSLHAWPQALSGPEAREFARQSRLAQAQQAVRASPESAGAWADYGRALLDQGQWEEAAVQLRTALEKDPAAPAVRRDLTYTLLHLQGQRASVEAGLDEAIAAASRQLGLGKGETRSRNFHDWHAYAMLLYRKAYQQRQAGDPAAAATLQQSREAIVEAIKNGRQGSDQEDATHYSYSGGYLLAMSSRSIGIAGFAYPEAAADFVLLDCLDTLATHPDNYLAWHTLSTALLDLQQTEAAEAALAEARRLRPDYPEALFTQALLALQRQDRTTARSALQQALQTNPRHPRANKLLAQLYAEEGDMVNSAACLAAHAQLYGEAP